MSVTPRSALRRLADAVTKMQTLSEAPTGKATDAPSIAQGKSVGNAPPGTFTGNYGLAEEWTQRIDRLGRAAEREVELAQKGALSFARQRDGLKERIVSAYAGCDPVEVAFIEGTSESVVRKTRDQAGLRTADGRAKRDNGGERSD